MNFYNFLKLKYPDENDRLKRKEKMEKFFTKNGEGFKLKSE